VEEVVSHGGQDGADRGTGFGVNFTADLVHATVQLLNLQIALLAQPVESALTVVVLLLGNPA
jgi:hypothetical protein